MIRRRKIIIAVCASLGTLATELCAPERAPATATLTIERAPSERESGNAFEPTPTPRVLILEMAPEPEIPAFTPRPDLRTRMQLEERRLELELQQARAAARSAAPRMPAVPSPEPGPQGPARPTMRELNFDGVPESTRDTILARHGMRIVTREVRAGASQNFLSSASTGGGDRYFAQRVPKAGVYEVFELSRRSIARMSELEEAAIRARGLDPVKAYVRRIVFGIRDGANGPDLAVLTIDIEKI